MKTISISVTAEDIANGVRENPCCCPIALALRREFHGSEAVVGNMNACVGSHLFLLPAAARKFVEDFDELRPTAPATFELGERS